MFTGLMLVTKQRAKLIVSVHFAQKIESHIIKKRNVLLFTLILHITSVIIAVKRGNYTNTKKNNVEREYKKPKINIIEQHYSEDLIKYVHNVRGIKESTLKHFKIVEKGKWFSFPLFSKWRGDKC